MRRMASHGAVYAAGGAQSEGEFPPVNWKPGFVVGPCVSRLSWNGRAPTSPLRRRGQCRPEATPHGRLGHGIPPPSRPGPRWRRCQRRGRVSHHTQGRCERCGRVVEVPRRGQRFCSSRCRWAASNARCQEAEDRRVATLADVRALLEAALRRLRCGGN